MKKLLGPLLAAALLAAPLAGPARAEKVDFGKITCGQFMKLDNEETAVLYFWLDGYVSAKTGNMVMDLDGVESDLTELLTRCNASPDTTVLKILGQ